MRLDKYLVEHKIYESRNKAQNAILNNRVCVNKKIICKTGYEVKQNDVISKNDNHVEEYVSRGAYKLLKAIDYWQINVLNKVVLDIGSSTGGFTDLMLKRGAKYVYAVDVGTNQLHSALLNSPKVCSLEQTHFKDLKPTMFSKKIDIVVADLSFISLTKLIDKLFTLLEHHYQSIFLIKPQFELTPKEIKKGKVINKKLYEKVINKIKSYALLHKYNIYGVIKSPIKGNKANNTEFLIYMEH